LWQLSNLYLYLYLIDELINTRKQLQKWEQADETDRALRISANIIRNDINEMKQMKWPPGSADLCEDNVTIGDNLEKFLKATLSGKMEEEPSERVSRLIRSYGQDLIYGTSKGRVKTIKSVVLQSCIKSLTNNTELINIINKLGHGISYSLLEELETETAYNLIEESQEGGVFLPEKVQSNVHTILVYDNIDRVEETLSGAGTTHRCNGIIVQPITEGSNYEFNANYTNEPMSKRKCRRSLQVQEKEVEEYILGKRLAKY
jgi:hypothetical protein